MRTIDERIQSINQVICDNISKIDVLNRGLVSQNILGQYRHLVEHIAVKIYSEQHTETKVDYNNIPLALENLVGKNEFYFLRKFHSFLQKSKSHYTPDYDSAERLVLKYYEYLFQIKIFVKDRYNMDILQNLEEYPLDCDKTLQEYYEKIAEKLMFLRPTEDYQKRNDRFYVQKSKPFYVNHNIYYENTLIPANDENNKFNRLVVFSKFKIKSPYAIKIDLVEDEIEIIGKTMPIKILTAWMPSIRPCEMKNFAKIFGKEIEIKSNHSEYMGLMLYMVRTGLNLVEILELSDRQYLQFKVEITKKAKSIIFCDILDIARKWVKEEITGSNVVRYLLYCMNNKIIKQQLSDTECYKIPGIYIVYKSLPFEEMPFESSLVGHNPSIADVFECINPEGHEHELLARTLHVRANVNGDLYTKNSDVAEFGDMDLLIEQYNEGLYRTHQGRRIEKFGQNLFIKENEDDAKTIITKILSLSTEGVAGYAESIEAWLGNNVLNIDSAEKKNILRTMFTTSKVSLIYGAAGTGKTTLMNYISQFWDDCTKLYLANTNPAVENLRRKIKASKCEFMTISKFITNSRVENSYDIVFVDECSMVSNRDMVSLLKKADYNLLILVGDIYQIEAIQFGNWFNLAKSFVPLKAQNELTTTYRTDNEDLLILWDKVRNIEDDIAEHMSHNDYCSQLDESIFEHTEDDEIILCLNYDGLYGINNINRFLQNANTNSAIKWGVWNYKVGDPILFNESQRFSAVLYNNLKGKIINIEVEAELVYFTIEIDRVLNELNVQNVDLELLPQINSGKSVVRFYVREGRNSDEDEQDMDAFVPFQIAYAVSIHKAQGLEYNSVKLVITKEVDERISHNIFYTAITRAKEKLKIYWSGESQKIILDNLRNRNSKNDAVIFAARTGLRAIKNRK